MGEAESKEVAVCRWVIVTCRSPSAFTPTATTVAWLVTWSSTPTLCYVASTLEASRR